MLKFTSIVEYTSCGPTYIESFLTIFGQCINVLNYNIGYIHTYDISMKTRRKGQNAVKLYKMAKAQPTTAIKTASTDVHRCAL